MRVRELIALIVSDGWVQVRVSGSHRQFHHPTKPEALALIREAIELHIDDLRQSGQRVPPPSSTGEVIEIPAA